MSNSFSELHRRFSVSSQTNGLPNMPFTPFGSTPQYGGVLPRYTTADLPLYIKPLPAKIGPDEVAYLEKKGALTVPKSTLRSEMLRAYVEFVHPYMPLLDLHDFLAMIDRPDGSLGKVSLILFQAVMFAGSAFVDMRHLRTAGYASRKEARKDFFQKTRVSHHFSLRPSQGLSPRLLFLSDVRVFGNGSHVKTLRVTQLTTPHRFCTTSTTNPIVSRSSKLSSC
jgi:hypothetical protein